MKKLFFGTIFLALIFVVPNPTMAMARGEVGVGVRIPLPPPIIFPGPPQLVVIPETDVYADPDVNDDIFFYGGWWWRPWEGRWYRSQRYDSGWGHYQGTPSFHRSVPSGWRNDYKQRRWKGNQWDSRKVPHQQVQQNWNKWEKDQHWKKQNNWGVRSLKNSSQQPKPQYRDDKRRKQDKRNRDRKDDGKHDRR